MDSENKKIMQPASLFWVLSFITGYFGFKQTSDYLILPE